MGECLFPCLLWRYNLGVVHVDLIHSVVDLTSIELSEDMLSEIVVTREISCIMTSEYLIKLGINGHLIFSELLSELVSVNCPGS
jgi:hypothetical protein